MSATSREFDIVVLGATGFTGKLVVEYLVKHYMIGDSQKKEDDDGTTSTGPRPKSDLNTSLGRPLRIAIAGRNLERLDMLERSLKEQFTSSSSSLSLPKLVIQDTRDMQDLVAICAKTTVMITTTGPYMQHGEQVVKACIESGSHYCDITGEVPFVQKMQKLYGRQAEEKKVKIVHFCGFDCVPSDLGTLTIQRISRDTYQAPCTDVRCRILRLKGGVSGGTLASVFNILNNLTGAERRDYEDAYALCLYEDATGAANVARVPQPNIGLVKYEGDVGYVTDWVMARVNSQVVRWSNQKLGYMYGKSFKYSEGMSKPSATYCSALWNSILMKTISMFVAFSPIRWVLQKFVLPKPGSGPSRETLDGGSFLEVLIGTCRDSDGNDHTIRVKVGLESGDPGYKGAATMVSECGLCMVYNMDKCTDKFGILSPASGIGMVAVERLRAAGMIFRKED